MPAFEFPSYTIAVPPLPANPHGVGPDLIRAIVQQTSKTYPASATVSLRELTKAIAFLGERVDVQCEYDVQDASGGYDTYISKLQLGVWTPWKAE